MNHNTTTCPSCNKELHIGDYPFCSKDGDHKPGRYSVIGDECDITTEHINGTPMRFTSKAEFQRTLKEHGLENRVRHVPAERGSDKSPHTVRWV